MRRMEEETISAEIGKRRGGAFRSQAAGCCRPPATSIEEMCAAAMNSSMLSTANLFVTVWSSGVGNETSISLQEEHASSAAIPSLAQQFGSAASTGLQHEFISDAQPACSASCSSSQRQDMKHHSMTLSALCARHICASALVTVQNSV